MAKFDKLKMQFENINCQNVSHHYKNKMHILEQTPMLGLGIATKQTPKLKLQSWDFLFEKGKRFGIGGGRHDLVGGASATGGITNKNWYRNLLL